MGWRKYKDGLVLSTAKVPAVFWQRAGGFTRLGAADASVSLEKSAKVS
jgi:hypothetical protein